MDSSSAVLSPVRRLPRPMGMIRAFSKTRQQKTTISLPVGPVKNSRGADLTRSNTLTIIAGIDDESGAIKNKETMRATSLNDQCTQAISSRSPSSIELGQRPLENEALLKDQHGDIPAATASTTTCENSPFITKLEDAAPNHRVSLHGTTLRTSSSVPLLETIKSSKQSHIQFQDENIPPGEARPLTKATTDLSEGTKRNVSRLPRSRTMGVLHELRASISRPGVIARASRLGQLPGRSVTKDTSSAGSENTVVPDSASSSKSWLPYASLTSLVRSSRSCTPEHVQPHQVTAAQPSAYWTGRFMALYDRALSEPLHLSLDQPGSKEGMSRYAMLPSYRTRPVRLNSGTKSKVLRLDGSTGTSTLPFSSKSQLPHANTTTSLSNMFRSPPVTSKTHEDDNRCHRIFQQLEGCCLTTEARQSFHDWQQAYARRVDRPSLLPSGRVMQEKGRMGRLFGGSGSSATKRGQQKQRQSLSGIQDVTRTQAKHSVASNSMTQ